MYISKNELIRRLVSITDKNRSEFATKTVETLSALYEGYVSRGERTYIEVPYKDKDIAKLLGAMYDGDKKKWYIPQGANVNLFEKWMQK